MARSIDNPATLDLPARNLMPCESSAFLCSSFSRAEHCVHMCPSHHDPIHFFLRKLACWLPCILLRPMHSYFPFAVFDSVITKTVIHIFFLFTVFWAAWVCHFTFQIGTVWGCSWKYRLFITSFDWMSVGDFVWCWSLLERSSNILDQSWCF